MPEDDAPMVRLVRDGRNATLSFLFIAFPVGGPGCSRLADVGTAIRRLDDLESSWAEYVEAVLSKGAGRRFLVPGYEWRLPRPAPTPLARCWSPTYGIFAASRCSRHSGNC